MRILSSLLLALVMALTSVSFASARVQEAGMTDVVICSMGSAMTVTLDAMGNPVDRPHHCPDCLAALPTPPAPLTVLLPVAAAHPAQFRALPLLAAPLFLTDVPLARGPPAKTTI